MTENLESIDDLRQRIGVAQAELCRRADVSPSTLSKARAEGKTPTPRILRKLRTALDAISSERAIVVLDQEQR